MVNQKKLVSVANEMGYDGILLWFVFLLSWFMCVGIASGFSWMLISKV